MKCRKSGRFQTLASVTKAQHAFPSQKLLIDFREQRVPGQELTSKVCFPFSRRRVSLTKFLWVTPTPRYWCRKQCVQGSLSRDRDVPSQLCDQIGWFLKFSVTNFLAKVAQILDDFLGSLEWHQFYVKTAGATFGTTFGWIRATFYFNIWAHCQPATVVGYSAEENKKDFE